MFKLNLFLISLLMLYIFLGCSSNPVQYEPDYPDPVQYHLIVTGVVIDGVTRTPEPNVTVTLYMVEWEDVPGETWSRAKYKTLYTANADTNGQFNIDYTGWLRPTGLYVCDITNSTPLNHWGEEPQVVTIQITNRDKIC